MPSKRAVAYLTLPPETEAERVESARFQVEAELIDLYEDPNGAIERPGRQASHKDRGLKVASIG